MFQITHPTTREFSRQHFAACAARIEADARSDALELAYLASRPIEREHLDPVVDGATLRSIDRNNLLYMEGWQNDII